MNDINEIIKNNNLDDVNKIIEKYMRIAFEEQELLDDTKYILFGLFEKFGATEIQKEKIKNFKDNYFRKIEEEKREQYNPDDIFKKVNTNIKTTIIETSENNSNTKLIKYKETFLQNLKIFC